MIDEAHSDRELADEMSEVLEEGEGGCGVQIMRYLGLRVDERRG